MSYSRYLYAVVIVFCHSCLAQEASTSQQILDYAQHELPHSGILKHSGGFVYLDVDDAYIHHLVMLIQNDGFEEPPYFGDPGLVGAHVTVIYSSEMTQYHIQEIEECGQFIYFTPTECKVVRPVQWQGVDAAYVLVVGAPQLELLRKKYELPQKKCDFHITLGIKPHVGTKQL